MNPVSDFVSGWVDGLVHAGKTIADLGMDAAMAPSRLGQAARILTGDGATGSVSQVLLPLVLLLGGALVVASLVYLLLSAQRRKLREAAPAFALPFAVALFHAAFVDAAPAAVYAALAAGGSVLLFADHGLIFSGTDTFRAIADMVISTSSIAWFGIVFLSLPLGVDRPGLRLFPIDEADAAVLRRFIRHVLIFGAASWVIASGLYYVWIGEGLPRLIMVTTGVVACGMCLRGLARAQRHLTGFGRVWEMLAVLAVLGLTAVWVVALLSGDYPPFHGLLLTVLILIGVPALDGMAALLLERLRHSLETGKTLGRRIYAPPADFEQETLTAIEQPLGDDQRMAVAAEMSRSAAALAGVVHEAIRWLLTIVAALLLAEIWSLDLGTLLGAGGTRTWFGSLVDAGLTLLAGWYAWALFEALLAIHLSREEGGTQSRARTIQPLLHAIGKLVIGAVAVMSALSSLGVNIAPLLASAGIIGIAVGFGAQTLVRDLFSGACYLIEDVFRVGDYIEGGSAKGVVERITFRTVALRHQNGPLYFVPYGSLGVVRNNSRDWVIDKFEIPLPITVQSEQIRRIVKKIGQEMIEDADLAKIIVQPLKAKLYRIEPGVKIFRCKFQTMPERQFELRTEAYRRIEAALSEIEIPFADTTSRVTVFQGPPGALQAIA